MILHSVPLTPACDVCHKDVFNVCTHAHVTLLIFCDNTRSYTATRHFITEEQKKLARIQWICGL